jgi:hypothetical protein
MTWTIGGGTDNGDPVIVSINDEYRDPGSRAGLPTRISFRFMGGYMLQSIENRSAFEDSLEPFLQSHGGVLVAGITKTKPVCYTFHAYCRSQEMNPSTVPLEDKLKGICTISVHDDPAWIEYERWLPAKTHIFRKIATALNLLMAKK